MGILPSFYGAIIQNRCQSVNKNAHISKLVRPAKDNGQMDIRTSGTLSP